MRYTAVAALFALATMVQPLTAQAKDDAPPIVRPGDPSVDGSFIRSFAASFELTRRAADGTVAPFGHWTDSVQFVEHEGRRLLQRVVARYDAEGVKDLWRDHLVDPKTLAPIYTYQRFGSELTQEVKFEFEGDSVTVTLTNVPNAPSGEISRVLAEPVYDLALYAMLLVGFPLEEGYAARFPYLGPEMNEQVETMRVTGRERVAVEGGGTENAYVVSTETRPWTVWLTKEAPYISKIVQRFPDGSEVTSKRTWVERR